MNIIDCGKCDGYRIGSGIITGLSVKSYHTDVWKINLYQWSIENHIIIVIDMKKN